MLLLSALILTCNVFTAAQNLELRVGDGWQDVEGVFSVIATGQAGVWAIDSTGNVFTRSGTYNYGTVTATPPVGRRWKQGDTVSSGKVIDIAVGYNIVWVTDSNLEIHLRRGINSTSPYGSHWEKVDGWLKRISVNSRTNVVWGLYSNGFIFFREGLPNIDEGKDFAGKRWRYVQGYLRFITVSDAGVWGLAFDGSVMYREGTREKPYSAGTAWVKIEGPQMIQIQGGNNILWAVEWDQKVVYYRQGITDSTPTGTRWEPITTKVNYISVNTLDGSVWGLREHGCVFRKNARTINTGYSPWSIFDGCDHAYGYRKRLRYCIENTEDNMTCSEDTIEFQECEKRCDL